jgi:hypothetical protein
MQRLIIALLVVALVCAGYLYLHPPSSLAPLLRPPHVAAPNSEQAAEIKGTAPVKESVIPEARTDVTVPEAPITLADNLNASNRAIAGDLHILADILTAWRTNFPHDGNPWGENAEITAALTGRNALKLALIPPNHRAINARGELCDRWGTPFRFHQLSGTQMEIRSAGPDQKFGTADDAVLMP